jgi:hypothetical protein
MTNTRKFVQSQTISATPLIILIAGPYQSGTDGDPVKISANLKRLESFSLPIYRAGHIPMIGEWVALPIFRSAESNEIGSFGSEEFLYPVAARLLTRCDAVLRIPGESKGADQDVRIARARGLPVFHSVEEIPVLDPEESSK